jgi:hypothetical protein
VSGNRSNDTTGGVACPDPFEGQKKFWPVITRRLFASSNVALVITSCGAGVALAVVTYAAKTTALIPRIVVKRRIVSNIGGPSGLHR